MALQHEKHIKTGVVIKRINEQRRAKRLEPYIAQLKATNTPANVIQIIESMAKEPAKRVHSPAGQLLEKRRVKYKLERLNALLNK